MKLNAASTRREGAAKWFPSPCTITAMQPAMENRRPERVMELGAHVRGMKRSRRNWARGDHR
jgi:hypothetical protein